MGFMSPQQPDPVEMFEQAFTDKAMQAFYRKFPDLVQNVVHFKVVQSDVDNNRAVGGIVVQLQNELLVFPVFFNQGELKPIDIVYHPKTKKFMPASPEWVQELLQRAIIDLGRGVEVPEHLQADQDLRPLVVPPRIGRYSFASKRSALLEFLEASSPLVKKAFSTLLQKNKKILKFAFEHYDKEQLLDVLKPRTVKQAEVPKNDLHVLTPDSGAEEFRAVFGRNAENAWNLAAHLGYVIKDNRTNTGTAVSIERPLYLSVIKSNAFARIYLDNGEQKDALVIANPRGIQAPPNLKGIMRERYTMRSGIMELPDPYANRRIFDKDYFQSSPQAIVFTIDNQIYTLSRAPSGEVIHHVNTDSEIYKAIEKNLVDVPAANDTGMFIHFGNNNIEATLPVEIENVIYTKRDDETVRIITAYVHNGSNQFRVKIITSSKMPNAKMRVINIPRSNATEGDTVWYLPTAYKFLRGSIKEMSLDPMISAQAEGPVAKTGEIKQKLSSYYPLVKVINSGSAFGIVGDTRLLDKVSCIKHLATKYNLNAIDAANCVEKAATDGKAEFFVVHDLKKFAALAKTAQPPAPPMMGPGMPPSPMMGPGMPPPPMMEPGMPPEAMGGMPPGMSPPPPPPSPVEIAASELEQQLMTEAQQTQQQLAEHEKDVQEKLQLIEQIKQRAQEIATGQPATPEEGAEQAEPVVEQAADLGDQQLFEAATMSALGLLQKPVSIIAEFLPQIEQAVDALARIIIVMWLKEPELKQSVGEIKFEEMEQKLRTLLEQLGEQLLNLNYLISVVNNEIPSA